MGRRVLVFLLASLKYVVLFLSFSFQNLKRRRNWSWIMSFLNFDKWREFFWARNTKMVIKDQLHFPKNIPFNACAKKSQLKIGPFPHFCVCFKEYSCVTKISRGNNLLDYVWKFSSNILLDNHTAEVKLNQILHGIQFWYQIHTPCKRLN